MYGTNTRCDIKGFRTGARARANIICIMLRKYEMRAKKSTFASSHIFLLSTMIFLLRSVAFVWALLFASVFVFSILLIFIENRFDYLCVDINLLLFYVVYSWLFYFVSLPDVTCSFSRAQYSIAKTRVTLILHNSCNSNIKPKPTSLLWSYHQAFSKLPNTEGNEWKPTF